MPEGLLEDEMRRVDEEDDEEPAAREPSEELPFASKQPTPRGSDAGAPPVMPEKLDLPPMVGKAVGKHELAWQGSEKEIEKWLRPGEVDIPITQLVWDKDGGHGQSRTVDGALVDHYVESMTLRKPLAPIRVILYDKGGVLQIQSPFW